jgi:large subunit ribosomal protein L1
MAKLTKNQKFALTKVEQGKLYTLSEAAALVKDITTTKFDASVDIDVRLGIDPRKSNQMVRGVVSLPNGTGKAVRVLALVPPTRRLKQEKQAQIMWGSMSGLKRSRQAGQMLMSLLQCPQ